MSTIKKAFISFAEGLAQELKSNAITIEQACERLKGFGYQITDSGCFYRTFTMAGSRSKFYIHIWGTLVSEKPWVEKFTGIAWGDKNDEFDSLEV
jgi:hypothetical protein